MGAIRSLLKTGLSGIFCLVSTVLSAQQSGPVIRFQHREVTLAKALKVVSEQTDIEFSYVETLFDKEQVIALNKEVYILEEFLDLVFKLIRVTWTRRNDLVILSKEKPVDRKKKSNH
ncbi:hypothetical protein FNH22_05815 [Fulvivirga sp. M361]|uniref:hypothetical protein n=1 Tax=Fulvivirga sp. M361 TaxID=2594266 RepID=UPI00117AC2F7|nr:hypothetical protein [Fulvivirga sp. M361]TRX60565.1 hypothetical protein FNH22_05815 [Fulvivirga sp. M361]